MTKIKIYEKSVSIKELNDKYLDKSKFQGYCKECPSYDKKHSCPPFTDEVDNLLSKYNFINVIVAKIDYAEEEIENHKGQDKAWAYTKETLFPTKIFLHDHLVNFEKTLYEAYFTSMGSCVICDVCEKVDGNDCKYPDRMRVSLEALGYDITGMLKDLFDIDILWAKDSLPLYYTLLGGLATVEKTFISEEFIRELEISANLNLNNR